MVDSAEFYSHRSWCGTGIPVVSAPANNAQFHPAEAFNIVWAPVAGANYYIVEADDDPTFSYPLTLSTAPLTFGTKFAVNWGNSIPTIINNTATAPNQRHL